MQQNTFSLYQAPMQGFTDFDFRIVLAETFGGIDKYFVPYLAFGKGREIKKSQLRDLSPENNGQLPVVPQVLFSDWPELNDLLDLLVAQGYSEINLNLGCPYPMQTNKGRGAAWLSKPDALADILQQLYDKNFDAKFSVKMRAGMEKDDEAYRVFEVLGRFPIDEIIFHPRTADQMYEGRADASLFAKVPPVQGQNLVYNGDILSLSDLQSLQLLLPGQNIWMIGRGLFQNPALAAQLKGERFEPAELRPRLKDFHDRIFDRYSARLQGSGHILMKMSQFWFYFSQSFENPHKAMKLVKKSSSLSKYNAAVAEIFRSL